VDISNLTQAAPWAIAATAFSSPMYLSGRLGFSDNAQDTGFDISPASSVVISFEGTYAGDTVTHQQTNDPAGLDGWFDVLGAPSDGSAATASGSDADVCYIFPPMGERHRIKVTALASGTIECRVRLDGADLTSAATAGGPTGALATEATSLLQLADLDLLVDAAQSTTTVNVGLDTSAVMNGATALTPKFAVISASASADLVAAVSAKKIRVLAFFIVVTTAVTVKLQSNAATDLTGAMPFGANGGISLPYNPTGWFETGSGLKLNMVLGSGVAVAGGLSYVEV